MSGIGAARAGGRWNSPGRHVVYAAGNLTLAMLELLVHLESAQALRDLRHVVHEVRFSDEHVSILSANDVPAGWDHRPVSRVSQVVGDEWHESRSAPVLAVPSVIVPSAYRYRPEYMNFLIHPEHPEFGRTIDVGEVQDLTFDPRFRP